MRRTPDEGIDGSVGGVCLAPTLRRAAQPLNGGAFVGQQNHRTILPAHGYRVAVYLMLCCTVSCRAASIS
jgi:hypothetical protein